MSSKLLSSGHFMPLLGLGTWQSVPGEVEKAVKAALEAGYRHIDTATLYKNEKEIGNSIQSWLKNGGKREELFITTKLPHIGNRPSDVQTYATSSLKNLQLDYLDLYLVHMPFTFKPDETGEAPAEHPDGSFVLEETDHIAVWKSFLGGQCFNDDDQLKDHVTTWLKSQAGTFYEEGIQKLLPRYEECIEILENQELENLVKKGLVRSIGVSNYNNAQLENVITNADIQPSILQVEMHVALQQPELQKLCEKHNVTLTAYSPLGSPGSKEHFKNKYGKDDMSFPDILNDPAVRSIAEKLQRSPAQVLLRFLVQQQIAVIPKSVNPQRIKENSQIFDFELTNSDIEKLKELDRGKKGRIVNFLFFSGVEKHAQYPFRDELV